MSAANCPKCGFLNPADAERCGRCGVILGAHATVGYLPGHVVAGNYRLVRRIGEGGMGEVWEAVQTSIDRTVAIKFLHPELMKHPTARHRAIGEGKALGRVSHSNVVAIHECLETDDTVALVLEFVASGSLADRIDAHGAVKWQTAAAWMADILRGLGALHRAGLVHRDLKPDNVLMAVDEDGRVTPKLTDLGVAHDESATRITRAGSRMGTFEFMAPELFEGKAATTKSDIYACGVMLYELLVGEAPFTGTEASIMRGHCLQAPDVARLPSDVPAWLKNALMRSLAKSPDERFDDDRAFRAALSESGDVGASEAPAAVPPVVQNMRNTPKKPPPTPAEVAAPVAPSKGPTAPAAPSPPPPQSDVTDWNPPATQSSKTWLVVVVLLLAAGVGYLLYSKSLEEKAAVRGRIFQRALLQDFRQRLWAPPRQIVRAYKESCEDGYKLACKYREWHRGEKAASFADGRATFRVRM